MPLTPNKKLLAAAEYVRDMVFIAECERDTDGDGDCSYNPLVCECRRIRDKASGYDTYTPEFINRWDLLA